MVTTDASPKAEKFDGILLTLVALILVFIVMAVGILGSLGYGLFTADERESAFVAQLESTYNVDVEVLEGNFTRAGLLSDGSGSGVLRIDGRAAKCEWSGFGEDSFAVLCDSTSVEPDLVEPSSLG